MLPGRKLRLELHLVEIHSLSSMNSQHFQFGSLKLYSKLPKTGQSSQPSGGTNSNTFESWPHGLVVERMPLPETQPRNTD